MKPKIRQLMLEHGVHRYISSECQSRVEFMSDTVLQECFTVIQHMQTQEPPKNTSVDFDLGWASALEQLRVKLDTHFSSES